MMQKLVVLALIFAVVAGVLSVLSKGVAMVKERQSNELSDGGDNMQRLSFFLLLALIAYVAASGAS